VYPEVQTPLRVVASAKAEPKPPAEVRHLVVKRARVPEQTRDGRKWDAVGGAAPDPYVVVSVDGRPILRTESRSNTFRPEWPDGPHGNFRLASSARMRVELWDANPVKDRPIGIREVTVGGLEVGDSGELELECDSGATIVLGVETPEARIGYGFAYEMQTYDAVVTKVFQESPAARAGLHVGDRILAIDHEKLREMKEGELLTRLNLPRKEGVLLRLRRKDGAEVELSLREGAIYPLRDELVAGTR
jgi:hypothetical protein